MKGGKSSTEQGSAIFVPPKITPLLTGWGFPSDQGRRQMVDYEMWGY